ncbi:MAG TPA: DUF1801 domain-containing protein [bacterium]|nr:DUF1801 domain-containing protein [bacterium]HPR89412.1 DUF1801 domain-containing protein [bacterium]
MAKNDLKTRVNDASVAAFLESIADAQKRNDSFEILEMMREITREEPKMWGTSIIGFGSYHYKGKGGREGDWMLTGFSPRKQNIALYLMGGFGSEEALLNQLGKFTAGVGCLYIKKLADVDRTVLQELARVSFERMKQQNK